MCPLASSQPVVRKNTEYVKRTSNDLSFLTILKSITKQRMVITFDETAK